MVRTEAEVENWIKKKLVQRQTVNNNYCAYSLKHLFENDMNGFYIQEDVFIKLMQKCGFDLDSQGKNTYFNISEKSEAIKLYKKGILVAA